jgi:NADPH-dependent 2,4-dienoyl-CoA reductase/sulfur reductase-like enzyme
VVVDVTRRVVVIGGDAAGMSAASQALRRAERGALEVVAFERGHHVSYSACGIPYWIAGDVEDQQKLVARTSEDHRKNGVDLRMRTEVTKLDPDARTVAAVELDSGASYELSYDDLVLATGAVPVRPDLPGVHAPGVYGVQTLDDGTAVLDGLARQPRRAVVVGCGYIGVEMAEAMKRRGLDVALVDRAPEPMTTLDPDMGALVREAMVGMDIRVLTATPVVGFETGTDDRVSGVVTPDETLPADIVVLGIGVRPATELARDAGLPLGAHGGVVTDRQQRVPGHEGIWAGGDCVEVTNRVSQRRVHVPLGTHANKHGRVIGTNLAGGYATFPGVVGTAVTKVCDLEIGRTGLLETEARDAGFEVVSVTVGASTRAGYLPGAGSITVKMIAEAGAGRLLGAQLVGSEGSGKRVDVCAVAVWNGMTVDEIIGLDLGYAPPFAPVWDPVLVAARTAASAVADAR